MRLLPLAGASAVVVVLSVVSSVPSGADQRVRTSEAATRAHPAPFGRSVYVRSRFATNCTTDYGSDDFVGQAGADDIAGGEWSAVLGGDDNLACDQQSAIGSGNNNNIGGGLGVNAFIGGGQDNVITYGDAFIGGGDGNVASNYYAGIGAGYNDIASGEYSFVGSGASVTASGLYSFVGSGRANTASGEDAFVGSGQSNTITAAAGDASIGGGNANYVSGVYGTVGGGSGNKAEGAFAVIPGGADDEALGAASFAAGYHAEAAHSGSFVWGDDVSGSTFVADAAANQFVVRASGGTAIYSAENLSSGVSLAAGSGTWSSLSDRNAKTDIVPLDDASVLEKVASLPRQHVALQNGIRRSPCGTDGAGFLCCIRCWRR